MQIEVWGSLTKFASTLNAGNAVIVEGKVKPETYTADGVEHKTFTIKADNIRKIAFADSPEKKGQDDAKSTKKCK